MNDLSPAYTRIRYHVTSHRHVMTFACQPDGSPVPGLIPDITPRAGAPVAWDTAVLAFVNLLKPMFSTTSGFDVAEFWSKPTPTSPPVFITAIQLGVAGTNIGEPLGAGEAVLTFRTPTKGGFKLYLMEAAVGRDQKYTFPMADSPVQNAIASFITGNSDWIIARNNNYPLVALTYTTKINDVLRDKYLIGG